MAMPAATAMPIRAAAIGAREDGAPAARRDSRATCLGAHGTDLRLRGGGLADGPVEPARRRVGVRARHVGHGGRATGLEIADGRGPSGRRLRALQLVGHRGLEQRLRRHGAVAQRRLRSHGAAAVAHRDVRGVDGQHGVVLALRGVRRSHRVQQPRDRVVRAPDGKLLRPGRPGHRPRHRDEPRERRAACGPQHAVTDRRWRHARRQQVRERHEVRARRRQLEGRRDVRRRGHQHAADEGREHVGARRPGPEGDRQGQRDPDARDDTRAAPVGLVPGGVAGERAHGRDDAETQLPRGPAGEERHEHADPGTQRPPASGAHPTQHIGRPHRGVLPSRPRTTGSGPCRPTPARRRRTA